MTPGPLPASSNPPFWYGSFAGLWVYYPVKIGDLDAALAQQTDGFRAFDFGGGTGLVNINFMTYAGHSGKNDPQAYIDILKPVPLDGTSPPGLGVEASNECEFGIVCFPKARQAQVPFGLGIKGFMEGSDHTKTLGSYRMAVPCDDRIAVYWGAKNFGETKVMTHPFLYNVPTPNNTPKGGQGAWLFTVPGMVEERFTFNPQDCTCDPFMFSLDLNCADAPSFQCNPSEIIDYSMYADEAGKVRPAGSRRNMFGSFVGYDFTKRSPAKARLTIGNSKHALVGLMKSLLGGGPRPVAIQVFQSQPVIAESAPYYVDL